MLPNLIALTLIAIGLVWAYVAPGMLTRGVLMLMMVFPPLVYQLGFALGQQSQYVSFIMVFGGVSLLVYLYRVATGTLAPAVPDLLWFVYAGFTFVASTYVS